MVYARRFMARLQVDGPLTRRWLPIASSAFITVLGLTLAIQALSSVRIDGQLLSKERLGPILFVTCLGLILGMRHSTDADHVVAISTIVSKQRSIRNAAVIGSVWGLGHTITIFIVGSLIILFGFEIPPRLGLSLEFSVALMLILLGVLNLTGVMQKMTSYFTPELATPSGTAASAPQEKQRIKNGEATRKYCWPHRSLSMLETSCHRPCSWIGWLRGGGAIGPVDDSQPDLGNGLSAHLRCWNDDWDDVHDRGNRSSAYICRRPL